MSEEFKNAWHNVRGISSEEMRRAVIDAERLYGDIIDLPHPVSKKHPPLTMQQKAAQFSPFAALTGYEDAIDETGRLTEKKAELDEDRKEELDRKLQWISDHMRERTEIIFTYFMPDPLKDGGRYIKDTGIVRKIDRIGGKIMLENGTCISIGDIVDADFTDSSQTVMNP